MLAAYVMTDQCVFHQGTREKRAWSAPTRGAEPGTASVVGATDPAAPPPRRPAAPDYWLLTLVPTHTPGGWPIRRGPKVSSFQVLAAVVAAGEAISFVHGGLPGLNATHQLSLPDGRYTARRALPRFS